MSIAVAPTTPEPLIHTGSRASRYMAGALAIALILIYLLLHNPYWVRHGDSEVFLSLARNIAAGEGYRFNGQPVAIAPPGWPLVLAAAMHISPSLSFLKLLSMFSVIGFLLISYALLLRWTTPIIAATCVLTAALLDPVFSLSYLFFSDGLFALIALAAVWTALRISDGEDSWWRIALLIVLCITGVTVRWAGLPFFAVIGAAVLHGQTLPRPNRRWLAFALAAAATVVTYFSLRAILKVDPNDIDPRYDSFVATNYDLISGRREDDSYSKRIVHFGEWIGGLFWRPMQNARITRPLDNAAGWAVSLIALIPALAAARRRQWIGLGAVVYVAVLGINWPDPISRYIVMLAPLILYGVYSGATTFLRYVGCSENLRLLVLNVFFISVLGINGLLYLMNVAVMRSDNFYEAFQGGVHKQLIDAASYLRKQPRGDYEIAISGKTVNFGREFPPTDGYRRALNFLSARDLVTVPPEWCRAPDPELIRWLSERNVRYYLYQPPIWQFEHYRPLTIDGEPIPLESMAWRLYEIREGRAIQVPLVPIGQWPREVPALQ